VNPISWTGTATIVCRDKWHLDWPWKYDCHRKFVSCNTNCFAVAVYDPYDLLEVKVFHSTSDESHAPSATATVTKKYIMVGGGATANCGSKGGQMLIESYPSKDNEWSVKSRDCHIKCKGTITAHAIGIKWRDPTNKPELSTVITSDENNEAEASLSQRVAANGALVGGGAKITEYSGESKYTKFNGRRANMLTSSYPEGVYWKATSVEARHHRRKAKLTTYAIGLNVKTGDVLRPFCPGCQYWPAATATLGLDEI